MADKTGNSLQRQVFPPGVVGALMYRASQMLPTNASYPQPAPQAPPPQPAPQGLVAKAQKRLSK